MSFYILLSSFRYFYKMVISLYYWLDHEIEIHLKKDDQGSSLYNPFLIVWFEQILNNSRFFWSLNDGQVHSKFSLAHNSSLIAGTNWTGNHITSWIWQQTWRILKTMFKIIKKCYKNVMEQLKKKIVKERIVNIHKYYRANVSKKS